MAMVADLGKSTANTHFSAAWFLLDRVYILTGLFTFTLTLIPRCCVVGTLLWNSCVIDTNTSVLCCRDTAVEFMCQTRMTVVNGMTSLNTEHMLIQTRRFATLLLLFAAFWSLVSTFVPTTAQPRHCIPFSWLTLKDILDKYIQLEHYGHPPI
jgi:hypothetical protein